jgi:hypothetical protein
VFISLTIFTTSEFEFQQTEDTEPNPVLIFSTSIFADKRILVSTRERTVVARYSNTLECCRCCCCWTGCLYSGPQQEVLNSQLPSLSKHAIETRKDVSAAFHQQESPDHDVNYQLMNKEGSI